MKCGAQAVVATDLDDTNRIRCIAEAMQRNFDRHSKPIKAFAHPFRWEQPEMITGCARALQELLQTDGTSKDSTTTSLPQFDVICATDCLFIIHLHEHLIRAVDELLADNGVAIFAFAIHASYSQSKDVWSFVEKVRTYRKEDNPGRSIFKAEILPSVQLTPPKRGMPDEQGLVHTIRITKESSAPPR